MKIFTSSSTMKATQGFSLSLLFVCMTQIGCSGPYINKTEPDKPAAEQTQKLDEEQLQAKKVITKQILQQRNKQQRLEAMARQSSPRSMSQDAFTGNYLSYKMAIQTPPYAITGEDKFVTQAANGVKVAANEPVSTFSIDVDTGSYSTMRRWINQGRLPAKDSVRIEELINYFNYDYPLPIKGEAPFTVATELAPSPYANGKKLLRIGLQGYELDKQDIGPSNLVFLLDVSGSMSSEDKLPLLKRALLMLTQQLSKQDKISIVVYAGASGVVLEGATGEQYQQIAQALEKLSAGGGTHGSAGINLAYQLAQKHFIANGVNRVILATDGDFNVGTTSQAALEQLIEEKRTSGISLTTLGFGQGNYNDHLMEQLANKGNGQYAYIDTLNEARKVLVDEISSSLLTIAQDVKIQVEFNPQQVAEYRLIGYENRALKREDFNNDKIDAGEIGAGHSVTALYEISYTQGNNLANDPLRYQQKTDGSDKALADEFDDEIAFVKLRYKPQHNSKSVLLTQPVHASQAKHSFSQASNDFKFAAAVAGFGQQLNDNAYIGEFSMDKIATIAQSSMGDDAFGYRHEFVQLVKTANMLRQQQVNTLPNKHELVAEPQVQSAYQRVN